MCLRGGAEGGDPKVRIANITLFRECASAFFVLRPPVLIRSGSYRLTDSAKRDMKNFLALLRLFRR